MKHIILIITLFLLACTSQQTNQQVANAAVLPQMRFHCDGDTTLINQLLQKGSESGITDAGKARGEIGPHQFFAA